MNAIELAEYLEDYSEYERATDIEAADMLRKQHAAIVDLRAALSGSLWRMKGYGYQAMEGTIARAEQALKVSGAV